MSKIIIYIHQKECVGWIDNQSKKLIHLKYLILETAYNFFSIFSWNSSFPHTEHLIFWAVRGVKGQEIAQNEK